MEHISSQSIFCANVKILRKHAGLTKKDFANKLQISVRCLTSIENGAIPPRTSCDVLENICIEFNVDPYILLCCKITD